jgi:hypothetical protein
MTPAMPSVVPANRLMVWHVRQFDQARKKRRVKVNLKYL